MSVEIVSKKMYRCTCEWDKDCGHMWEAPATDDNGNPIDPPARCARCKRFSWNGRDRRSEKAKALPIPKPKKRRRA